MLRGGKGEKNVNLTVKALDLGSIGPGFERQSGSSFCDLEQDACFFPPSIMIGCLLPDKWCTV